MASNAERQAKQLEEEAELEAALFGENKPAEKDETVLDDDSVINPEDSTNLNEDLTDDPFKRVIDPKDTQKPSEELATLRKQLADETHRYNRFKGSTDRTISGLRTDVIRLNNAIVSLKGEIAVFKSAEIQQTNDSVFTQDVVDVLGEDAVNAIKTIVKNAEDKVAKVEEKMDTDTVAKHKTDAEKLHEANVADFYSTLGTLVPDYKELDKDPKFVDWLESSGPDGIVRMTRLRKDQKDFDPYRVADFFIEYRESTTKTAGKKPVADVVDNHRGPAGKQSGEANHTATDKQAEKGTIKQSEINAHLRLVAKGEFKNDSVTAEAWEMKIFNAMQNDNIVMDERPVNV